MMSTKMLFQVYHGEVLSTLHFIFYATVYLGSIIVSYADDAPLIACIPPVLNMSSDI